MFPPKYFDNFPPGGGCSEGVQYNGGLLLDIILLTRCDFEELFRYHEEFLSLQPMFPTKSLDNFPPEGGCSEGLNAFRFFLKWPEHIIHTHT